MYDMNIEFEWDERKRLANIEKHGLDFFGAMRISAGDVVEVPSRGRHDEQRFIAYGVVAGRVIAVVYTWRGERRRLISARRATRDEQKNYARAIGHGPRT